MELGEKITTQNPEWLQKIIAVVADVAVFVLLPLLWL